MNLRSLPMALLWLAALGLVVIFGARVVSKVGNRASSNLPAV